MLRVVVAAPPVVTSPADLLKLPAFADLIELRFDLLDPEADEAGLREWIAASPRPVLATLRRRGEGGACDRTAEDAARFLEAAARAGAAWIDVEREVAGHLAALPGSTRVVASFHGGGTFQPPASVAGRAPVFVKRACRVATAPELEDLRAWALAGEVAAGPVTVAVPFGPLAATRAAFSRGLLYGAASNAARVVEGQPALGPLLDELRAGEVTARARLYGLLGRPPSHSPSPALHNAAFRHLGLDALYVPVPGLEPAHALDLGFSGFSVTMPFKRAALAAADVADEVAAEVGAANTLVLDETRGWVASNTDVGAVEDAVPRAGGGETAFVYGAGGYARAAVFALRRRGYAPRLGARRPGAGRALADEIGVAWGGERWCREASDRVVVNATPLGAGGAGTADDDDGDVRRVFGTRFEDVVVLDAPYRSAQRKTGLARVAAATARRVVDGRDLLLAQARRQALVFHGRPVPSVVWRLALRPPTSLFLLGLRGAGKSEAGRRLARRLGRPFVDLDAEVERLTSRSAADWIREEGEAAFREVEAEALARLGGRSGLVVAGGGGAVECEASRRWVEENAVAVWLDVEPETAAARLARGKGASGGIRPALFPDADPEEEARRLHARRRSVWHHLAEVVIDGGRDVEEVVEELADVWIARTSDSGRDGGAGGSGAS